MALGCIQKNLPSLLSWRNKPDSSAELLLLLTETITLNDPEQVFGLKSFPGGPV